MSYLLDRKLKRKKLGKIALGLLGLFLFFYFRVGIFGFFSSVSSFVFRPVLNSGNMAGQKASAISAFFRSKDSFMAENESLKKDLEATSLRLANYNSILDENMKLREILGRKKEGSNMILGAILSKPNRSPYDTLLIDVGERHGIKVGDLVLASGAIPVGRIAEVFSKSSKVVLFSTWGEKNQVVISGKDIFIDAVGRGGGNFEMVLSRELVLEKGTEVLLPGSDARVVGVVETTISDPRDAFNKVLVLSPVNIQELKFVQVETQ